VRRSYSPRCTCMVICYNIHCLLSSNRILSYTHHRTCRSTASRFPVLLTLGTASAFVQPSSTCSAAVPAQHLPLSGFFSRWPHGLELSLHFIGDPTISANCFRRLLTSLRCHWQTRTTQCLAPTVLYTDVDGERDKLTTDDGHQFTTLTINLSWQHLRRSAVPETCLVPTKI